MSYEYEPVDSWEAVNAALREIETELLELRVSAEDEGSSLSSRISKLNFTGAGVTATASGDEITVDIP